MEFGQILFFFAFAVALAALSIITTQAMNFLALAWHEDGPVFRNGKFTAFWERVTTEKPPYWVAFGIADSSFAVLILECLACQILFLAFLFVYGISPECVFFLLLTFFFGVALVSDLAWREIPHEGNHIIAILAIVNVLFFGNPLGNLLLGLVPAAAVLLVAAILYKIFPERGFGVGGGDIRFIASTGMLMGFPFTAILLTFGSFGTILVYFVKYLHDRRKGVTTYVPMMVGFTIAYLVMLGTHYLIPVSMDMIPMLSLLTSIGVH